MFFGIIFSAWSNDDFKLINLPNGKIGVVGMKAEDSVSRVDSNIVCICRAERLVTTVKGFDSLVDTANVIKAATEGSFSVGIELRHVFNLWNLKRLQVTKKVMNDDGFIRLVSTVSLGFPFDILFLLLAIVLFGVFSVFAVRRDCLEDIMQKDADGLLQSLFGIACVFIFLGFFFCVFYALKQEFLPTMLFLSFLGAAATFVVFAFIIFVIFMVLALIAESSSGNGEFLIVLFWLISSAALSLAPFSITSLTLEGNNLQIGFLNGFLHIFIAGQFSVGLSFLFLIIWERIMLKKKRAVQKEI
jgi:hypothetical protein